MSVCPRCTHAAPEGARFCPACGGRLGVSEPARFASPDAYTPPHLAQRILDARAALEGERKQVTVLFADIHGFIDVLDDRDPEEVGPILDRVRELMMEAVHRYEGTVNQVVGDGIMALFGAPLANEDHAVRACYAALRMQELHRRDFQVEVGDAAATIRDKVATRLRALDPELEDGVSAILWVLGVPPDGGFTGMDPALRRRQVMRTVHRLMARQGRLQPFVMILEDMQWADSETHAAMDALVEALPPYTLVASTYRPEYVDRWSRHPGFTEVRVEALEPTATDALLDALLGAGPALTPLK